MTKKTRCSNAKTANSNAVPTRKSENSRSRRKRKVQQTLEFTGLFWRSGWDSNPRTLADQTISSVVRLWQIHDWSRSFRVTLLRAQKPRRRKGLRTFRPVSAGGDSNRPKVQIKPRSCVNSPRSCAFARSQARKQRPQQRR